MPALDTDRREDVKLEAEEFAYGNDALSDWESEWDDLNELERLPSTYVDIPRTERRPVASAWAFKQPGRPTAHPKAASIVSALWAPNRVGRESR